MGQKAVIEPTLKWSNIVALCFTYIHVQDFILSNYKEACIPSLLPKLYRLDVIPFPVEQFTSSRSCTALHIKQSRVQLGKG